MPPPHHRWILKPSKAAIARFVHRPSKLSIEMNADTPAVEGSPGENPGDSLADTALANMSVELPVEPPLELTVIEALELIFREILIAIVEGMEFDPHQLVAAAEELKLQDAVQVSTPDANTSRGTASSVSQDNSAANASGVESSHAGSAHSGKIRLRTRASSMLLKKFPLLFPESRRPLSTSQESALDAERAGAQLLSTSPSSESSRPLLLSPSSVGAGSAYAASSVFEPYSDNSIREALIQANAPHVESACGVGSVRTSCAHSDTHPSSHAAASTAANERSAGGSGAKAPFFSGVELSGGPIKVQAREALSVARRATLKSDKGKDAVDTELDRYVTFIKEYGWMLLSICAHSATFLRIIYSEEELWTAVYKEIGANATSFELYAAYNKLEWELPLPPHTLPACRDKMPFVSIKTRQVISLTNDLYTPEYKGIKQVDIEESFYTKKKWPGRKPRTAREARDGHCALCGSLETCNCEFSNGQHALVELREYPGGRGIGVRSLRSIKSGEFIGEYVGEMRNPPAGDTTFVVEQVAPGDDVDERICLLDAATYGNWTRFLNHSCRPATVLVSTLVGKTLRVLVRASRDIAMFEEITTDYGALYFDDKDRACHCGAPGCLYPPGGDRKGKDKAEASTPKPAKNHGSKRKKKGKGKGKRRA